jgi:hypothetical protein
MISKRDRFVRDHSCGKLRDWQAIAETIKTEKYRCQDNKRDDPGHNTDLLYSGSSRCVNLQQC